MKTQVLVFGDLLLDFPCDGVLNDEALSLGVLVLVDALLR